MQCMAVHTQYKLPYANKQDQFHKQKEKLYWLNNNDGDRSTKYTTKTVLNCSGHLHELHLGQGFIYQLFKTNTGDSGLNYYIFEKNEELNAYKYATS